ncbi:hypothetical protein A2673_00650 [Candidatus Kaiserbacteria bacterium RIFCSPHIGHO2_01_FULL_50_13]|uniref:Uncharacterized protein n=1 Tax=Candidatus Kaiserbacteria bacterium RIFCSPLOWO2_01_FULL_50_24 TaxID=1798507 RepID=A0A1F6ERH9_9BACT|nr:MAG: hypothetical protein A2673_00650 [Candidatus Kaiserbacteria bacterium RIFCSPHIGHO2_01_FULL_50_13]OGG76234.1 MAG: hypothetical protein A3A34_03300 [Candidatus Kaiserbacteria bacterium RIFCSPLOWO2_01_FULL_50_24]OGG81815.1 MAG: hypothetical protein A3H74_02680 [Candidatus Kaiserbacteria bacterium RIFCSPLOWO2_02_FULL_51_13]
MKNFRMLATSVLTTCALALSSGAIANAAAQQTPTIQEIRECILLSDAVSETKEYVESLVEVVVPLSVLISEGITGKNYPMRKKKK